MKKVFDKVTVKIVTLGESDVLTDSMETVDAPFSTPLLDMKNSGNEFVNPFQSNN